MTLPLHNQNIYILHQTPTTIQDIIAMLLNVVNDEVNWVKWDGQTLTFSVEMPTKQFGGFRLEFTGFNSNLSGEQFMYKLLRPKKCSKETKTGSIVFDKVDGERGLFVTTGANGRFYATFDNKLRECVELWEEVL